MSIILDHQLRECIPHNSIEFPITYFHDELVTLPSWAGPLHWHPDFVGEAKIRITSEEEAKRLATTNMYILNDKLGKKHKIFDVKRM